MTWREVFAKYQSNLAPLYNVEEINALFFYLWEWETGLGKIEYYSLQETSVETNKILKFLNHVEDLKLGKPVQYIINESHFYGLSFFVNQHVLIPRPETEELVDWILQDLNRESISENLAILDVGTGSGCIPISIAHHLNKSSEAKFNTLGIDISVDALEVAMQNAKTIKVNTQFLEFNILEESTWKNLDVFDVIVSNPPYICPSEAKSMHTNVLSYEPHLALFVKGNDPLLFYRKIALFALSHLSPKGKLYFEINPIFEKEMVILLRETGFKSVEIKKDMQLKARMIMASK